MKDLQPQDALVRYAGQTVEVSRSPTMHRRARFSVAIAAVFALISAGCGSRADEQAVDPVPETAESPALVARQTGEPSSASVAGEETVITEDTTTDTDTDTDIDIDADADTTTTTSTPITPVPPLVADVALIGSIRTVPDGSTTEENLRSTGATDAVIASLACTRSTGCEPTDLATWAANEVDVLNLATSRAALDGATLLSDYADVLLASGVATVPSGPRTSCAASGLGSNVSKWLGPPSSQIRMQDFAARANDAACAFRIREKPAIPKPSADNPPMRRTSRRSIPSQRSFGFMFGPNDWS